MSGIMSMLLGAVSSAITDVYFNLVTLLLPGNGTNGAQNNTFLDSSTNNFTITRNGNTTQGTFSPFSQTGWSNYFDGSSVLSNTTTTSTGFNLSTGSFTIEAWVYVTAITAYQYVVSLANTAGNDSGLVFGLDNTGKPYIGNGVVLGKSGSTAISANSWTHIAVVSDGTNIQFYTNGTANGSAQAFNPNTAQYFYVGRGAAGSNALTGYISNVRVTKGQQLYTGAFTPSTSALTTTSQGATATNVHLLTCQSNRFVDNGTNTFAITVTGTPSVQAFSPFAPTAAYSAATVGGSGYFDGTTDYLTAGAASDWTFMHNGSDWTCEFWVYHTGTAAYTIASTTAFSAQIGFTIAINSTYGSGLVNGAQLYTVRGDGTSEAIFNSTALLIPNQWNYVAITFTSSTKTCAFTINGASAGSTANTGFSYSTSAPTNTLAIGRYQGSSPGNYLVGYLGSLRISTNVRTGLTTIPTSPYTSDANTKLLTNFTNAGITDATAKNDLETVGNAQISTTQSKFGGSSMYFDGTGDYLTAPSSQNYAFVTGDFTVEFWIFLAAGSKSQVILDTRASGPSSNGIAIAIDTSNNPYVYVNSATLFTSSTALSLNTWTHVAVAKSSGTITLYLNGTKPTTGSGSSSTSLTDTALTIGTAVDYRDTSTTLHLNGYIDDLRITKGFARYTANFTAPAAALPLQ